MGDLTLHETADMLGVHYMTAYRYVRLGLLPAHKKQGGWVVRRCDVETFRATTVPCVPMSAAERGRQRRAPWAERLHARLVAGDGSGAWTVVEAALTSGFTPQEVYLEVITPALSLIEDEQASGCIDEGVVRRANVCLVRILGRMGPRFARRGRTQGTVVVGTPQGDRHSIPVGILSDLIRGAGYGVEELGRDVPPAVFASMVIGTERLTAVCLCVRTCGSEAVIAETIREIRATGSLVRVILVGTVPDRDGLLPCGEFEVAADPAALMTLLKSGSVPVPASR